MHSFEVHSNKSACRKRGRLGLDQVFCQAQLCTNDYFAPNSFSTNGGYFVFPCSFEKKPDQVDEQGVSILMVNS